MVERFTTAAIELPHPEDSVDRVDLIFYGLDHSGDSFEARVFLNAHDPDAVTEVEDPTYAGRFFLFGHGGCFGDVGHCDVPTETDPFDLRMPHQLLPAVRIVTVTDPVKALLASGATTATVTAVARTPGDSSNAVLAFDTVRLATYAH
jgi:hypothetical protein